MNEMIVAMCNVCRGWYSMDFEEALPDHHYNARTGQTCYNEYDWFVKEVPYREDWYNIR